MCQSLNQVRRMRFLYSVFSFICAWIHFLWIICDIFGGSWNYHLTALYGIICLSDHVCSSLISADWWKLCWSLYVHCAFKCRSATEHDFLPLPFFFSERVFVSFVFLCPSWRQKVNILYVNGMVIELVDTITWFVFSQS